MDIAPLNNKVNPSTVPFDRIAGNANISDSDKLKEVCKQFEAVLLRQMLGEARKTLFKSSEDDDNSNVSGIYNDMVNNQLADSISQSGAFGLAKSLQSQLVHQVLPKPGESFSKLTSAHQLSSAAGSSAAPPPAPVVLEKGQRKDATLKHH
jgi:peptidoglycan hydrolase FlgJ